MASTSFYTHTNPLPTHVPIFHEEILKDSYSYHTLQVRMPLPPQAPRIAWPDSVPPTATTMNFLTPLTMRIPTELQYSNVPRERNLGPPRCPLRGEC